MVSSTSKQAARFRSHWQMVRLLGWRAPVAVTLGLLSSVALMVPGVLLLARLPVADHHISGQATFLRELVQLLTYTGCALLGMLVSLGGVVALSGQVAEGRKPSLGRAFGRAVRRSPRALVSVLVACAWVAVTVIGAPVFVAVALVRALVWELRRRTAASDVDRAIAQAGRRDALVSAIPYLPLVRAVVLVAITLTTAVLRAGSVRSVLAQSRIAARGRTLRAVSYLLAPLLLNTALTLLALPALEPHGATAATSPTAGALALVALYLASTTVLGLALALLAGACDVTPSNHGGIPRRSPMPWRSARMTFRAKSAAGAGIATLLAVAMVATNLAQSTPAQAATTADIVVNTLADSLTPDPAECQTSPTCSLRGALAYATTLATPPMTITFSVSGTIATADTLQVPNGVTLDGHDGIVLDGQNAHGVVVVVAGDSASAAFLHIAVINGKSATAGAGVKADTANLTLDHVHFANNVSGVSGSAGVDGGAVEASYASVTVVDSTFDHNSALAGRGAAVATNNLTWTNSTSYADYGAPLEAYGGALYSSFGGTVTHATVVAGGGISGEANTPLQVVNTLSDPDHNIGEFPCRYITGSTDPAAPSVGNIDVTGSCGGKTADPGPVGPLANNGGPTPTVQLLAGAGAIGAADSAHCAPTDQRGTVRPASSCDAGAYQLSAGDVVATVTVDPLPAGVDTQSDSVTVHVEVPSGYSPAGHLTVLDGTTVNGPGVAIAPDGPGGTMGAAMVPFTLAPGKHSLSVRYTPASSAIAVTTSASQPYDARADASAKITASAPLTVGQATAIHVTLSPVDASAASLTPTGDVQVSNGATTTTLPLVGGSATWTVPALLRGTVSVHYLGDDFFRAAPFSSVVSTSDVASATALALSASAPTVGVPTAATVHVTGGGVPAYGAVHVSVDGNQVDWGTLAAGRFTTSVSTDRLTVGTHTVTVTYAPEAGWAASTATATFQVLPAPITATLTFDHPSITWGDFVTGTVNLSSAHDGNVTVDLMAGTTVLTTTSAAITGGHGSVSIPLFEMVRPTTGPLHVRVTGDGTYAPSSSPDVTLTVAAAPTATLATVAPHASPPVANAPMTLRVDVTPQTANQVPVDGTVKVFLNGILAGTFHVTQTSTDVQVTSPVGGMVDVRTEFTDTSASPALLPSHDERGLTVAPGSSAALTGTWGGSLHPGDTHLSVTLPGATGALRIVDYNGTGYGTGTLVNGTAQLDFAGHAPNNYWGLSLVYGGDATFAPTTVRLPAVTLTGWPSATTVTAPATTMMRDGTLTLTAHVTGIPAGTTGQVTLSDGTNQVTSAPLGADGTAALPFTAFWLGVHALHVAFVPANGDVVASSSDLNVTVVDHAAPVVTLTQTSPAVSGSDFTVDATVPAGSYGVNVGDTITLVRTDDPNLRTVAAGALVADSNGQLHAAITVHSQAAGPLSLTAVYYYGIHAQMTSSAPLVLAVAPATPTLLATAPGALTYGDLITVHLSADAPAALKDSVGVLRVHVTANGQDLGIVPLAVSGTSPLWAGTVQVAPQHAGPLTIDVTTAGDGASIGPATAETTVLVHQRATTLSLSDRDPTAVGRAAHGVNVSLDPVGGFANLTAADLAALHVGLDSSTVACQVSGSICEFPQGVVPVGASTAYASYPGSSDFLPSYASTTVHAGSRTSDLAVTMDPPTDQWVAGKEVKATWHTTTSGAPALGTVYVDLGSSSCQGEALTGSCTLKVPPLNPNSGTVPTVHVSEKYVPSDDAPPVTLTDTVIPKACVRVSFSAGAHFAPGTGKACGPGQFLTGVPLTVVADPAHNYHVDGWLLNGQTPPPTAVAVYSPQLYTHTKVPAVAETLTFIPTANTHVEATQRWAPACYMLRVPQPYKPLIPQLGGFVTPYTQPNCSSPWLPTTQDHQDMADGDPSYAEGTVVSLTATPVNEFRTDPSQDVVAHPAFAVDTWSNATPDPANPKIATLTMNADTTVDATFKVADCDAFTVAQPEGGTVRLVSTQRPDSTRYLRPASGACTTSHGRPGYIPGTTAVVEVTPHNDGSAHPAPNRDQYFLQNVTATPPRNPAFNVTPGLVATAVGAFPDSSAYRTQNVSLELSHTLGDLRLTAQMAHIACTPLTVSLQLPSRATPPDVRYGDTPDCPAIPATSTVTPIPGGFAAHTSTVWYVDGGPSSSGGGTNVSVADTAPVTTGSANDLDYLHPVWALAVKGQPLTSQAVGYFIPLSAGSDPVIVGRWMSDRCQSLHLSLPTGGHMTLSPAAQCPAGTYPDNVDSLAVTFGGVSVAHGNQNGAYWSALTAWFSVPVSQDRTGQALSLVGAGWDHIVANGRVYARVDAGPKFDWPAVLNTSRGMPYLQVELCAPVQVDAQVKDANGNLSPLRDQNRVISTDSGGCPPGWGGLNQTLHVGLTEAGNYAYEIVGPVKDQVPTTTVDSNGDSQGVSLELRPYCFHLSVGSKVDVQSPANCPGAGDGNYLKGSVVTLTASPHPGDHFHGWAGVTSSDGQTAYVAMTQDQSVTADIGTASLGDKIAAVASSTTQRILSGLVTAATDLTVAEMSVVSAVSLAIKGATKLATLLGAPTSVVDAMTSVSTDIDAQMNVITALSTCTSAWANGGSGSLVPGTGATGAAAKAADKAATKGATTALIGSGLAESTAGDVTTAFNPIDLVNGFGSNAGNYLQDPNQAWSDIGSIGSCMVDTIASNEQGIGLLPR